MERKIAAQPELTDEEASKDIFFQRIAKVAEEMVATHGKDFAMGALVLAARWIAADRLGGKPGERPVN